MWDDQPEELARRAITYGEHWADEGVDNGVEAQAIWDALMGLQDAEMHAGNSRTALNLIYSLCCLGADPLFLFAGRRRTTVWGRLFELPRRMLGWSWPREAQDENLKERGKTWCPIIRCVFGNPFRPVAFDPNWRTSTAVALAQQIYASRDFSAMPILADALQDTGCDNAGILDHCRGPGPHVRGCWVVDLVLGKE